MLIMNDENYEISSFCNDQISDGIRELMESITSKQCLLKRYIDEQKKRHDAEVKNLRQALDRIGKISTEDTIRPNKSVQNQTIDLQNTLAVVSTLSESDKITKKSRKKSNLVQNVSEKIEIEDDHTLPSNCSGRSVDYWKSYPNNVVLGNDCKGNAIWPGDIVEILSGSKNGTPFKRKDEAKVHFTPGVHIMLSKVGNDEMIGFRSSKNLRITQSNH